MVTGSPVVVSESMVTGSPVVVMVTGSPVVVSEQVTGSPPAARCLPFPAILETFARAASLKETSGLADGQLSSLALPAWHFSL